MRVVRNKSQQKRGNDPVSSGNKKNGRAVEQREIDEILDKISSSGYDKLTREEKETLFKASKH